MKIGIFLHPYGEKYPAGLARAILDLTKTLLDIDRKDEYFIFAKNKSAVNPRFTGENWKFFTANGETLWMDALIKKHPELDVCIFNTPVLPLRLPKKSVVLALDFAYKYLHSKNLAEYLKRKATGFYHGFSLRRANAIVAISQATKADLIKFFNIPNDKIKVVYLGFQKICDIPEISVDVGGKFFLFSGAIKERKNVQNVIKAFNAYNKENNGYRLVVTGHGAGEYYDSILSYVKNEKLENKVMFLKHCNDAELSFLYKRAEALIFPSFIEGFGFPILEAMDCGLPVITSKTSSLWEIAGDAALLVDPHNFIEIKNVMSKITSGEILKSNLIERGRKRAQNFSWKKCAEELLEIVKNA